MIKSFKFFFKRPIIRSRQKERKILNLPEIKTKDQNYSTIKNYLEQETPIWTWNSLIEGQENFLKALDSIHGNYIDGLTLIRKEEDFIAIYTAVVNSKTHKTIMKIREILKYNDSNIMELLSSEIRVAHRVYFDDVNLHTSLEYYVHDVTTEELNEYFLKKRVFHVADNRFIRSA